MLTPDKCTKEELRTWPTYELQVLYRESSIDERNGELSQAQTGVLDRTEQVLVERDVTIQRRQR